MSVIFSTVKCFVFAFNLVCLILGVAVISVSTLGLEYARPGTDEHTYFIVGIIIGSLVCMSSILGCYGVICEQLGVNLIYVFFLLLLLLVQYLQMQNFQPQNFHRNAMQHLENSWHLVKEQPHLMQFYESNYHCCGLYNSRDYNYMGLIIPESCYHHGDGGLPTHLYPSGCMAALQHSYQFAARRETLFNWALIVAECIVILYSLILSGILYRQHSAQRMLFRPVEGFAEPLPNNIGSRTHLLSN